MKSFILNRIKEPSTWAALTALGAFMGVPPGVPELVHQIAVGVCGLIAVFAPEATK
jgi:hypothetical protein